MITPVGTTLLLGFDPRTAFAVARSLHRCDVRVVVGTLADWESPIPSRAISAFFSLPRLSESPAGFFRELRRLIDRENVDTVIPLTDRALVALAPHDAELRKTVRLLAPTAAQIHLVLDKTATARRATDLGIPVPTTVVLEEGQNLQELEKHVRFPVFLKPESKARSCHAQATPGPEVFSCETPAALRTRLREARAKSGGKFLVQEHVPGDDVGIAVVMHRGEPVSIFQYRAERTWPAEGGVCVAGRSEVVHTGMAACALRLLRALDWEGVAELDFRHDPATDRFALLEVNGRFWGSTAAAVAAGADMPRVTWRLGHEQPLVPERYRAGQAVRWLEGDLRRLWELVRRTEGPGGARRLARELATFCWDFRPTVRGMYWSWRDPGPAFHAARIFAHWWCFARARQVWRWFRPAASSATPVRTRTKAVKPAYSR